MTIRYWAYWYRPTWKFPSANGMPWVTAPKMTVISPISRRLMPHVASMTSRGRP